MQDTNESAETESSSASFLGTRSCIPFVESSEPDTSKKPSSDANESAETEASLASILGRHSFRSVIYDSLKKH